MAYNEVHSDDITEASHFLISFNCPVFGYFLTVIFLILVLVFCLSLSNCYPPSDTLPSPSPECRVSPNSHQLTFHPTSPSTLLSGSTDGLVNVINCSVFDEDEAVIQTFNHDASIHRAGFLSEAEVFALSHDERFAVYSMAEETENGAAVRDFGDVREAHVLGCQYIADVAVKRDGSGAVLGAGAQE
jgi:hypothetical protein